MNQALFDRTEGDTGNIVALEHVNLRIPDQQIATIFYVMGLGLTRDPYLMTGVSNMWINAGRSQFHLPTGAPTVLHGSISLVIPKRSALLERLFSVRPMLQNTQFDFHEHGNRIEVTCPWGNQLQCFEPSAEFGRMQLGMPSIEIDTRRGSASGIAHFYKEMLGASASTGEDIQGAYARVAVGENQNLFFREGNKERQPDDNQHIQIYIADFLGPYERLRNKNLISQEDGTYQYRFRHLVDLNNGEILNRIEHEVRSIRHPLFARPLINRNPAQSIPEYMPGHDQLIWTQAI